IRPFFFHFLLQHVFALHTQFQSQRRCHIDGRCSTDGNTDKHGQREAFQYRTTEEVQHQDNHQGSTGCDQGTVQRLGQGHVKDFVRRTATDLAEGFTNTVRYHDTVVKRVTDNRHQRCDNGQVNLAMEYRQNTQRHDNVVRQRNTNPCRQSPLKAKTYVHKDRQQRRHQRHRTGLRKVCPHARTDELNTLHCCILIGGFVNHLQNLAAQHLTAGFAFSRRHTDHDVVAATKVLQHWLFKTGFLQCITSSVNFSRFFERNFDNRTTGEIQPPVKAAHAHNNDSGD